MEESVFYVKPETEVTWDNAAGSSQTQSSIERSVKNPLLPTIFHEHWWLNCATRGSFEEVEVREGVQIVGKFPFYVRKYLGFKEMKMPCLTYFLGPVINE